MSKKFIILRCPTLEMSLRETWARNNERVCGDAACKYESHSKKKLHKPKTCKQLYTVLKLETVTALAFTVYTNRPCIA
jgi:hypothetical protein